MTPLSAALVAEMVVVIVILIAAAVIANGHAILAALATWGGA